MSKLIEKGKTLKTVNEEVITDEILKRLTEQTDNSLWIRDGAVGDVCVFHDDRYPKFVIECVMGNDGDSSVTTLFERNTIFNTRQELFDVRKALMTEIGVATQSLPSLVAIQDKGRGRDVFLREMSTAQLVDVLEQVVAGVN